MSKTYFINSVYLQINSSQVDRISDRISSNEADFLRLASGPEHILPQGVKWKSLEHALYVTYTCLIDYNLRRAADELWASSRKLFEELHGELYPENIVERGPRHLTKIFQKYYANIYRAPASPAKMAYRIFRTAEYLLSNAHGDPRKLLATYLNFGYKRDTITFLKWLKGQKGRGLPNGDKVIKLWFRTMCESEKIQLGNGMWDFSRDELSNIPLPVDKNIISAGIALGLVEVVSGTFEGSFSGVKEPFHDAWMSVANKSNLLPLELDEPTWKIGRRCRRKKCIIDCFFKEICPRINDFMFKGERNAPGPAWDILVWPSR